jgi:hypothetical protein
MGGGVNKKEYESGNLADRRRPALTPALAYPCNLPLKLRERAKYNDCSLRELFQ